MMGSSEVRRKGAWTIQEDKLLRNCVEKYGEGRWHKVPLRAGLNRCRKSCRLRWLNYLKPNIKKGKFTEDEVDLIIRLHKLLGNRWALIAGRIPGRTANDVKNYWNTRLRKKMDSCEKQCYHHHQQQQHHRVEAKKPQEVTKTIAIKPRPGTLSKGSYWVSTATNNSTVNDVTQSCNNILCKPPTTALTLPEDDGFWWESLIEKNKELINETNTSTSTINGGVEEETPARLFNIEESGIGIMIQDIYFDEAQNCWSDDFSFDAEIWNDLFDNVA